MMVDNVHVVNRALGQQGIGWNDHFQSGSEPVSFTAALSKSGYNERAGMTGPY